MRKLTDNFQVLTANMDSVMALLTLDSAAKDRQLSDCTERRLAHHFEKER